MHAGVQMFPSAESITPNDLAVSAERCGFESVFFPDHTHVPLGDGSPGYSGHDVPEYYRTTMDHRGHDSSRDRNNQHHDRHRGVPGSPA